MLKHLLNRKYQIPEPCIQIIGATSGNEECDIVIGSDVAFIKLTK
jgi:hypothetical protein